MRAVPPLSYPDASATIRDGSDLRPRLLAAWVLWNCATMKKAPGFANKPVIHPDQPEQGKSKTRDFIARLTAISVVVGLSASTILSFVDGNFQKLQAVWDIAGVYIGYIFATYMTSDGHRGAGR